DGALIDRQNDRAFGQKVANGPRIGLAHAPLSAVAVTVGGGGVRVNVAVPANAAEPRKCLAKDLDLKPNLLLKGYVLVVAASTLSEMRASGCLPSACRRRDFDQLRPNHFLLAGFGAGANLFPRQNVRHKDGIAVGMAEAIASVHELLNRYCYLCIHLY